MLGKRGCRKNSAISLEAGGQEPRPRLTAYWGVYIEKFQQVALFKCHQRRGAERAAKKLLGSQRTAHFARLVEQEMDKLPFRRSLRGQKRSIDARVTTHAIVSSYRHLTLPRRTNLP